MVKGKGFEGEKGGRGWIEVAGRVIRDLGDFLTLWL
jgi:hypothetical protein